MMEEITKCTHDRVLKYELTSADKQEFSERIHAH